MLVLTRKRGQFVELLDTEGKIICRVCVIRVNGEQIKLGFDAAKEVRIKREEIEV